MFNILNSWKGRCGSEVSIFNVQNKRFRMQGFIKYERKEIPLCPRGRRDAWLLSDMRAPRRHFQSYHDY